MYVCVWMCDTQFHRQSMQFSYSTGVHEIHLRACTQQNRRTDTTCDTWRKCTKVVYYIMRSSGLSCTTPTCMFRRCSLNFRANGLRHNTCRIRGTVKSSSMHMTIMHELCARVLHTPLQHQHPKRILRLIGNTN